MRAIEGLLLGYLLNSLWQAPLLYLATWAGMRLMRRVGVEAEHWVAVTGLLAAVVVPACRLPGGWTLGAWSVGSWFGEGAAVPGGGAGVAVAAGMVTGDRGLRVLAELQPWIVGAYVAGLLWLCGRLLSRLWLGSALRRGASPVRLTDEVARSWDRCCRRFGVCDALLASSAAVSGPVTLGIWRRVLLLPTGFLDGTDLRETEAALAHELAHIRRRDYAKNLLYELVTLPVAFHPVVSLMKRQVAESRELVCDALAAEAIGAPGEYARSLLRLASMIADRAPARTLHAIGIFDANILERRVMSLTTKRERMRFGTRLAAGAACVLLGVAACGTAVALRMEVKPATASAKENKAKDDGTITPPKIVFKKNPVYPAQARADKNTVNGAVVLKVVVGVDGMPENIHIVKSLREDYDRSALEAVREWRFDPGMKDGKPIEIDMEININFQLQD